MFTAVPASHEDFSDLPRVMTTEEVAELLRTSPSVISRMANSGDLPARKVGKRWLYMRDEIIRYLTGEQD
jgi:excisionase family DNA binding protein